MQHSVLSTQFFDESERLRIQHMEQYPDNKMIRGKQVLRGNLHLPATQQEWLDVQRSCIDVRRAHIHSDTLREMQKLRFDPMKLVNVRMNKSVLCVI